MSLTIDTQSHHQQLHQQQHPQTQLQISLDDSAVVAASSSPTPASSSSNASVSYSSIYSSVASSLTTSQQHAHAASQGTALIRFLAEFYLPAHPSSTLLPASHHHRLSSYHTCRPVGDNIILPVSPLVWPRETSDSKKEQQQQQQQHQPLMSEASPTEKQASSNDTSPDIRISMITGERSAGHTRSSSRVRHSLDITSLPPLPQSAFQSPSAALSNSTSILPQSSHSASRRYHTMSFGAQMQTAMLTSEREQLAQQRDQLEVDREAFEQEREEWRRRSKDTTSPDTKSKTVRIEDPQESGNQEQSPSTSATASSTSTSESAALALETELHTLRTKAHADLRNEVDAIRSQILTELDSHRITRSMEDDAQLESTKQEQLRKIQREMLQKRESELLVLKDEIDAAREKLMTLLKDEIGRMKTEQFAHLSPYIASMNQSETSTPRSATPSLSGAAQTTASTSLLSLSNPHRASLPQQFENHFHQSPTAQIIQQSLNDATERTEKDAKQKQWYQDCANSLNQWIVEQRKRQLSNDEFINELITYIYTLTHDNERRVLRKVGLSSLTKPRPKASPTTKIHLNSTTGTPFKTPMKTPGSSSSSSSRQLLMMTPQSSRPGSIRNGSTSSTTSSSVNPQQLAAALNAHFEAANANGFTVEHITMSVNQSPQPQQQQQQQQHVRSVSNSSAITTPVKPT